MLISAKLISEDGSSIKPMDDFPMHVEGIVSPAGDPEVTLMEVIVTHEHEKVFAQAKIETNVNDCAAVKSPTPINPHCAKGQRCPANISVSFRMTPTNPSRAPS
jgi:hypothetical protein